MRKIIIGLLILVACVFSFYLYSYGFSGISSMSALQVQKDDYDEKVALMEKDKEKYNETLENLRTVLAEFSTAKEQYTQVSKYVSADKQEQAAYGDYYDLEYLWTIIGTHGIRNGVDLGLVCTTSATPSENEDYIFADLNFTVEGEYKPISDFIEDCEDDNGLEFFSVSHFKLVPYEPKDSEEEETKANYVTATFVVKDVPLSLETLELIDNQVEDGPEAQESLTGDLEDEAGAEGDAEDESDETNSTSNETSDDESNSTSNETSDENSDSSEENNEVR